MHFVLKNCLFALYFLSSLFVSKEWNQACVEGKQEKHFPCDADEDTGLLKSA